MDDPLIAADDLCKSYRLYRSPWSRLRDGLRGRVSETFEALSHVSFELGAGDGLGVVGENGAGKSTLLRIVSGVTTATSGKLEVRGRVASLLELGMGFHPELSGRHNIRLNAAMMGLTESEVESKAPHIVEWSELGSFIDHPVKTYSSGMAMRLGFAIAVQVEPDVLIIDEALSVGDGYFQKKCMDKIRQLLDSGCTFLFCSHAMYYVSNFCSRVLWLQQGRVAALGEATQVVREYESYLLSKSQRREGRRIEETPSALAWITGARLLGVEAESPSYRHLASWGLEVEWETVNPELAFHLGVAVDRNDGVQVCSFSSHRDGLAPLTGESRYQIRLQVPELPVKRGQFEIYLFLVDEAGLHLFDQRHVPDAFSVESAEYDIGLMEVEHRWDRECLDPMVGRRVPVV